jgi:hypothetical protein
MTMNSDWQKPKWYWPKIVDLKSAEFAVSSGVWAAGITAAYTGLFATIALLAQKPFRGLDEWAYVDAAIFALIAWRVQRHSRPFALFGLACLVAEPFFSPAGNVSGWIFYLVILMMFFNGVRGVFGYHRFASKALKAANGEPASDPAGSI